MTKMRISMALLVASLILLIIYAVDELMESSHSVEAGEEHEELAGFLPFNEATRANVFAGSAIIMSIIGFVVERKEPSFAVSTLLLINGALIYAIILIIVFGVSLTSGLIQRPNEVLVVGSVFTIGAVVLIGLGIWKRPLGKLENNIK